MFTEKEYQILRQALTDHKRYLVDWYGEFSYHDKNPIKEKLADRITTVEELLKKIKNYIKN